MFSYDEGEISIGPYENFELSFVANQSNLSSSSVALSVWPVHHEYALKELIYDVVLENEQNNGDLNQDENLNVFKGLERVTHLKSKDCLQNMKYWENCRN